MARWGGKEEGGMDRKMVRWRGNGEETSPPHHFQLTPPSIATSLPPHFDYNVIIYVY